MTQDRTTPNNNSVRASHQKRLATSHYALLGLHPSASGRDIRRAYRELSKLYHPDTTVMPRETATRKFQQLNEAYATLSSPERRTAYDRTIGYSSVPVVQPLPSLHRPSTQADRSSSAYLDATDRPLSPGELFALFILGITFLGCLCLAIAIGLTREDSLDLPVTARIAPLETIAPGNSGEPRPLSLETAAQPASTLPISPAPPPIAPPLPPIPASVQSAPPPQPTLEESASVVKLAVPPNRAPDT